jgi:hypothetical protein
MSKLAQRNAPGYDAYVPATAGIEAITLGKKALTRHPSDTGAFFMPVISSMAGCAGHLNRWSVPSSDCDNPARPAAILLSPDVGGLQSKEGVPL